MAGQLVKTFDVHKQRPVVGGSRWLQNADDGHGVMQVVSTRKPVAWLKLVAHFETRPRGHDRADHALEERVRLEVASAGLEFIALERTVWIRAVINLFEELGSGCHDAEHR